MHAAALVLLCCAQAHPPLPSLTRSCRKPEHLMGLWLANLSNFILCFTYFKAVINTLLVKMGVKKASGFKVGAMQMQL
jgi:hypothetical protein